MPSWDINKDMPDLTGKVAIVTGGNTGIGKELVRHLALHNAKVYMASRTESRALSAIEELKTDHPELGQKAGITFLQLDLTSIHSCQMAAQTFLEQEERLDILLNNAGVMAIPYKLTADGVEVQFQSNHLGHFAFTIPLLPLLIQTSKDPKSSVRVVQITALGHNFASGIRDIKFDSVESVNREFSALKRYGQSKLANILFAKGLACRLADERIFSSSVHPGTIRTELSDGFMKSHPYIKPLVLFVKKFLSTPYAGAVTPLYAATAPEIEENDWRGEYFVPMAKNTKPSALAQDAQLARDLWDLSEKLTREKTEQ